MKTQYRYKGIPEVFFRGGVPGPWRDSKTAAVLDAVEFRGTGKDEEIEMRATPDAVPQIRMSRPPTVITIVPPRGLT